MKDNLEQAGPVNHDDTRERILDEAERLFAEHGFDAVSVRQITAAAHCHLAAVNYHFSSKYNLYLEVFRARVVPRAKQIHVPMQALAKKGDPSPEEVIRTLAKSFVTVFASEDQVFLHKQLMMQAMASQGEPYDLVITNVLRPGMERVLRLLAPHFPKNMSREAMYLNLFSLLGQMLYFVLIARQPISNLLGRKFDAGFSDLIVEHITSFCLNGLSIKTGKRA